MTLQKRFWSKVKKTDKYWLWTGYTLPFPLRYGRFMFQGKVRLAHRVSYEMEKGNIPDDMLVLHKCDVPPCVNPDHLFLGTTKDNAIDREMKHRGGDFRGEKSSTAKLTKNKVLEIRRRVLERETLPSLAKTFGVCIGAIRHIVYRRNWRHI